MFDKNEFLEVLVKNKKKMVLSDLIFELSKTTEDRKSTRLNSSHWNKSRMPSSA